MVDPGGIGDEADVGLSPGTRLGKYEVVRQLGAGGMGAVYEAAHVEIGKQVAIKVLSPAIAAVPGARARFLREAQLTSRVRHPNIVDVTDMGSDAGQTYLVMELLRGEDLAQRLERFGPLPSEQLADIMLPVCSAVVEAHKLGITHRDLKPQNIFLAVGPHAVQPKVLDFGISKGNDIAGGPGSLTGTGAMIGTPFYLAPEQIVDTRAAGPASDQYALGVIMYECLTGKRPFEAENLFVVFQAIVGGNPPPPTRHRPGIPAALEAVVMRAMHVEPTARFATTVALGRALLPFATPRTRSIWEEAFVTSTDAAEIALPARPTGTPIVRQPGTGPAPLATPTPPGTALPAAAPMPAPRARVRESVGLQTPPASGAMDVGGGAAAPQRRGPASWMMNPEVPDDRDLRPQRSNATKALALVGGVVLAGLLAAALLQRKGGDTPASLSVTAPTGREPVAAGTKVAAQRSAPETEAPAATAVASSALAPPQTFAVSTTVQPESAAITLDGEPVGQGRFERVLPLDRKAHTLVFTAEGYEPRELAFTDEPPPREVTLSPVRRATRTAEALATSRGNTGSGAGSGPAATRTAAARASTSRPVRRIRTSEPIAAPLPASPQQPRSLNPNGAPVID